MKVLTQRHGAITITELILFDPLKQQTSKATHDSIPHLIDLGTLTNCTSLVCLSSHSVIDS